MVAWAVAIWEAVMWAAASRVELAAGAVTLTTPAEAMRAIAAAVIVAGEELPGAVTTGMVAAGMDEGGTVVGGTAIAGDGDIRIGAGAPAGIPDGIGASTATPVTIAPTAILRTCLPIRRRRLTRLPIRLWCT